MKTILPLGILAFLAACGSPAPPATAESQPDGSVAAPDTGPPAVRISDPNLDGCVREALGVTSERPLTSADLGRLKDLQCRNRAVGSLEGLEHATALEHLSLWENAIEDISELTALTRLSSLQLGGNQIEDIAPISGLTRLRRLGLSINRIDDLQALSGLEALEWLTLDHNDIDSDDLAAIAGLPRLRWLTLEHTRARSAQALEPLTKRGCRIYTGLASVRPTPDTDVLPDVLRHFRQTASKGRLVPRPKAGGEVAFVYEVDGKAHETFAEYGGAVTLVRGQVRYQGVAIGDLTAGVCRGAYSRTCEISIGRKLGVGRAGAEGAPIYSVALRLHRPVPLAMEQDSAAKNEELVPYTLASPNQFDAGSCLFMSNTGAMEILMNQLAPLEEVQYQGQTDLSERYLMNASSLVPQSVAPYAITDSLYTYNHFHGSLLNADYPFTAGFVMTTSSGGIRSATGDEEGAEFSCRYNWINELPDGWRQMLVPTPDADRTLIFVDPKLDKNSVWRVGIAEKDVVERIKWELRTKNAPVIVIYNHFLYWHASIVVGYDDTANTHGCPMVESMLEHFESKGADGYVARVRDHMARQGGCSKQGVFLVRDSIYEGGDDEPEYRYASNTEKEKYSKRIVKRSYNWVTYVGNHAYTVHRK